MADLNCSCVDFGDGDLRNFLFIAACPVHAAIVFGKPKEDKTIKRKVCGDCYLWMTRKCPNERNVSGWNRGPSMNGIICEKFSEKNFTVNPSGGAR